MIVTAAGLVIGFMLGFAVCLVFFLLIVATA